MPAYNKPKPKKVTNATIGFIVKSVIIMAKIVTLEATKFINGFIKYSNIALALFVIPDMTSLLFLET
jgi:hypothetical protein